jgi:serine/threonine protein kinase
MYILSSVIKGLSYLKNKGVNHGNIRPFNILFNEEGILKLDNCCTKNFLFSKNAN